MLNIEILSKHVIFNNYKTIQLHWLYTKVNINLRASSPKNKWKLKRLIFVTDEPYLLQKQFYETVPQIFHKSLQLCVFEDKCDVNDLEHPLYGSVHVDSDEINGTATYQCNQGRLHGNSQRQCLPNGQWSGTTPSCSKYPNSFIN